MAEVQPRDEGGITEPSRRRFLKRSGLGLLGAGLGGGALAACSDESTTLTPSGTGAAEATAVLCSLSAFTAEQAATVEALTARILPGTPDDPGAREAGVVRYIDCLLGAGDGFAQPTYRQPPYPAPEPEDLASLRVDPRLDVPPLVTGGEPQSAPSEASGAQPEIKRDSGIEATGYGVLPLPKDQFDRYGYQSFLGPKDLYRRGLTAVDDHATNRFGAPFRELTEDRQDQVVEAMANDAAEEFDVPSAEGFFELLRRHTVEGMFSDPMYGGNADMAGWRLIGYPGAQRAYTPGEVRSPRLRREPQTLAALHSFNPGHGEAEHDPTLPVAGSPLQPPSAGR